MAQPALAYTKVILRPPGVKKKRISAERGRDQMEKEEGGGGKRGGVGEVRLVIEGYFNMEE